VKPESEILLLNVYKVNEHLEKSAKMKIKGLKVPYLFYAGKLLVAIRYRNTPFQFQVLCHHKENIVAA
jgi:hypothetical protein